MKKFIFTCGITGCGKSRYLKGKSPVVETDQLRKELLDDVNDLSQEKKIFGTAFGRILDYFKTYDVVYFDATMVENKHRTPFLTAIKTMIESRGEELEFQAIVFPADIEVSRKRILKDLKDGKNRANSIYLLEEQYQYYQEAMEAFENRTDFYLNQDNITYL